MQTDAHKTVAADGYTATREDRSVVIRQLTDV